MSQILFLLEKSRIFAVSIIRNMRWLLILCTFAFCLLGSAQVIENPVFDRTDQYTFRVKKVEIKKDSTYVHCIYNAEAGTWANISEDTFLEDISSGNRLPLLKAYGLPFSPEKRHFTDADTIQVILCFPHIETSKFNIIENEDEKSFNIYGIDINRTYTTSYTSEDISIFFDLAQKEEDMENWQSAVKYSLKQLEATDYVEGIRSFPSACAMYNLTMQFFGTEEYDKVIEWGNKAIGIINALPKDTMILDCLARAYNNVSVAYYDKKEYALAQQYKEKSLAVRRFIGNGIMSTYNYERYLQKLAQDYYFEENYPKALLYGKEVTNIYENKYRENPIYGCLYIQSLSNLCEYYQRMSQSNNAVKYGKQALSLIKKGICEDHPLRYYVVCNNLAAALVSNNQIDEGINLLESLQTEIETDSIIDDVLSFSNRQLLAHTYLHYKKDTVKALALFKHNLIIIEDNIGKGECNYPNYTSVLSSLHDIYILMGDYNNAMLYLKKAINVQKEWNGEESIAYANLIHEHLKYTWAEVVTSKESVDSLLNNLQKVSNIIKRHLNNSIYNMSGNQRREYWQRYKHLFTWFIPTINGFLNTKESNTLAYDAALFYKGMLLSSDNYIKEVILTSDDSSLVELYNNYINNKSQLEKAYNHIYPALMIDSLKRVIQDEEYKLSQKVTRFDLHNKGTDFSWKDIQKRLKDNDVAIEIVSYERRDGSDIYYDAYVIRKDFDAPLWIPICSEHELLECLKNDSIDYVKLSIAIWGNEKFLEVMKGVQNVYFSTSGLLNTIGIEYLPIADNQQICDKFNLYRLSSTRELCMEMNKQPIEKVYLYGGLDYNNTIFSNEPTYLNKERITRSLVERISQRGEFDRLIGSERETEQISKELSNNSINCLVLSGKEGTEESFKKLNGNRINIVHMSTHGMYISSEKDTMIHKNNFNFILSDNNSIDDEDKALSRSFLVMSGGNMLIHRDSIPKDIDDGILTALEISHLDFKDLDLVVLSACQTALGETNSEGVFGLQRGFKKAGANTILMSLDKVDDEATRILMVEFYKNLMSGHSKQQSLKNAQKHLRSVENGKYDDPKYWASFIMLDGLN